MWTEDDFKLVKSKINPDVYLHSCIGEVPPNPKRPGGCPNVKYENMFGSLKDMHDAMSKAIIDSICYYHMDWRNTLQNGYIRGYLEWVGWSFRFNPDDLLEEVYRHGHQYWIRPPC